MTNDLILGGLIGFSIAFFLMALLVKYEMWKSKMILKDYHEYLTHVNGFLTEMVEEAKKEAAK